ncbi:MAG: hypothetical protein ABSH34_07245 [Verrucomicrobiota bacterium]|jgi:hypothetical protein
MGGAPLLNSVVVALAETGLDTVLMGNAAAAIQGAPVTAVDFDFMFRAAPVNVAKLKEFADRLLPPGVVSPLRVSVREAAWLSPS